MYVCTHVRLIVCQKKCIREGGAQSLSNIPKSDIILMEQRFSKKIMMADQLLKVRVKFPYPMFLTRIEGDEIGPYPLDM